MTYEEALSRANFCIEEWKMFLKDKANTVEAVRYQNDSSQMQFFEVAAEAINKQIPKKPTHESTLQLPHTCPSCKNVIDRVENFFGHNVLIKEEFCRFCGQAIDWSDEE